MNNISINNNYYRPIYRNLNTCVSNPQISSFGNTVSINNKNSFSPIQKTDYKIRTSLSTKEEKQQYNTVLSHVDKKTKKILNTLLKQGKLLNNNSDDKSTVLENLYNITQKPRIAGLDKNIILKDVIERINYAFIIPQKFGDLPEPEYSNIIKNATPVNSQIPITPENLNVHSCTCPAASLEFDIAHRMPAEFARMAESLSSEKLCVTKTINTNDLSQGLVDTLWMLNDFKTPHRMKNWNTLEVDLKPDRNAIIRARVQNTYKDPGERSSIDVLMQSTFMNIGAQTTYDSLIDRRIPKYNDDDSGLIDIEKNFIEELATGKGKVCVTYQKMDDDGKLVGYECELSETLQHIRDTLNQGENVIIGYTYCDENNLVIGGHEITIIGIEKDRNGKENFVCNDTDDGIDAPIKYPVDELLPRIHHAGIPKSVLKDNVEFVDGWKELMQIYKNNKQSSQTA